MRARSDHIISVHFCSSSSSSSLSSSSSSPAAVERERVMKFWCGSLLLCLLIVLQLHSCVEGQGANEPQTCCFSYYKKKMRQDVIKKYDILRGDCPTAGVVFTTQDGRRVCVERVQGWVQRAMDKIDQQSLEKSRDLSRVNTTTPHN